MRSRHPRIFIIRGGLGWRVAFSLSLLIGQGITMGCHAKKETAPTARNKQVVQTGQSEKVQTGQNIGSIEGGAINASSSESKGLSLRLDIPARVPLGKPVVATITLKNGRSAYVQVLLKGRRHGDYGLFVVRADGVKCQRTEYGSYNLADDPDTRPGSAGARRIAPSEKSVWEVDLNKCFKLSEGRFTASVELNVYPAGGGGMRLLVGPCAFDVVPAAPKRVVQE